MLSAVTAAGGCGTSGAGAGADAGAGSVFMFGKLVRRMSPRLLSRELLKSAEWWPAAGGAAVGGGAATF